MAVRELLLVRHGCPAGGQSATRRLSPEGRSQARQLAHRLRGYRVATIAVSPSSLAHETAAPLAEAMGHSPVEVSDLGEIPHLVLQSSPEAVLATTSSIVRALDRLLSRAADPLVAITHGEVINLYLGQALNIPRLLWFTPAFASINRVHVDAHGQRRVITVNDCAHLEELVAANG